MRGLTDTLEATPRMEWANVENTPVAQKNIGLVQTGDGYFYDDFIVVDNDLKGDQLVRFGFHVKNGAAALAVARVSGRVELRDF